MSNRNAIPPEHSKFKKGETGNPNGRPKKLPDLEVLLADVLGEEKDGKTAAQAILMALRAKAAKGDVRAAEVLLDRGWGKVKQALEVSQVTSIRIIRDNGGINNSSPTAP